ncbi:MAG: hypothetical protein ACLPYS_13705 [Vulcanimicrobiaceae bacterium]
MLIAVAEQLLFRRRLDERIKRFEAIAQRVEAAAARIAAHHQRPSGRWYRSPWITVLALVGIVGLGAWFVGGAVAGAHIRFASARIASAVTTPAGAAAMHLLEVNGDDLPKLLARCRRFSIQGRAAASCTLWDEGPAPAARSSPWSWLAMAMAATPAWPFAIVAGVALATLPIVARRRRYIKIVRPEAKEHSC